MGTDAGELRRKYPNTVPSVMREGPLFGFGYRSPWHLGNVIQAKVARKFGLNVMLAQQSAREIERTGRSFQEVVDSASVSAHQAGLTAPWGADGDHLKTEHWLKEAVAAGCTHLTYDVSEELKQGMEAVIDRVEALYKLTVELKGDENFTTEVSLDETETTTKMDDVKELCEAATQRGFVLDEIAPRFPGYFEKAIDYYSRVEGGVRLRDTSELEDYLQELANLAAAAGFRVSIHSGSDKFSVYPIAARILKRQVHLKTAGTYYLEELKIVARRDPGLFREILELSIRQFGTSKSTYELSAGNETIPDLTKCSGEEIARFLQSGSGNDDLRQVLHVSYGSVLTAKDADGNVTFRDRMERVLRENESELELEMEAHIRRHVEPFIS